MVDRREVEFRTRDGLVLRGVLRLTAPKSPVLLMLNPVSNYIREKASRYPYLLTESQFAVTRAHLNDAQAPSLHQDYIKS